MLKYPNGRLKYIVKIACATLLIITNMNDATNYFINVIIVFGLQQKANNFETAFEHIQ